MGNLDGKGVEGGDVTVSILNAQDIEISEQVFGTKQSVGNKKDGL